MMKRLRSFITVDSRRYPNELDRQRAIGIIRLVTFTLFILSLFWVFLILSRATDMVPAMQRNLGASASIAAFAVVVLVFWGAKTGRLWLARWVYVIALTMGMGAMVVNGFFGANSLLLALPLIAAGTLMGQRIPLIAAFLMMFVLFGVLSQSHSTTALINPSSRWVADLAISILVLVVGAFHLWTFNALTTKVARDALAKTDALERINRFFSSHIFQSEQNLYSEVINFVRDLMNASFVQVFYKGDDGRFSRRMRGNLGIRAVSVQIDDITLSDGSPMMRAISLKEPVSLSRDQTTSTPTEDHLLSGTRNDVLIPILHRGEVLGLIDVQSDRLDPFTDLQIQVLTTFANVVGERIVYERLVSALRENIFQQEEIIVTLRERLQEMRNTQGVGGSSWHDYFQQRRQEVVGFNFEPSLQHFTAVADLPPNLRPVIENRALQITTEGDHKVVNIPIMLADEVLGAMSFSIPKTRSLTERQIETARLVAGRLALALENKRLFEQIQSRVSREIKATQAANLLITATDVTSVMNVAVANFSEAMGAIATRIHLQPAAITPLEEREVVL
jgi:GAF domain-containing protein